MGVSQEMGESIGVAIFAMLIMWAIPMIFNIVCYVLESLGFYTIAKRRGIHNPWLAWIPVGNTWILGSISDQYRFVARDKVTNRRKILLALAIAGAVLGCIVFIRAMGMYVKYAQLILMELEGTLDPMTDEQLMEIFGSALIGLLGVGAIAGIVSIVQVVFTYIALYDVFTSCDPNNSTMYLVLSILLSVTRPFFVFASRNKDQGMPPRRTEVSTEPAIQSPDPWEQTK